LYSDGKLFGLICDNRLFIKPTTGGLEFIAEVEEAPPYEGAKPAFLIGENIGNREWLSELVRISVKELPMPKPKKRKNNNPEISLRHQLFGDFLNFTIIIFIKPLFRACALSAKFVLWKTSKLIQRTNWMVV
jgi:TfoX/Sxy family transcriptional regulator of competence genes